MLREVLKRTLTPKTVYIAKTYSTDTYVIKASCKAEAKAHLFDEGVEVSSVELLERADEALAADDIRRM